MAEEWKAHINYEKSKMITHTGDTGSDKEANVCVETTSPQREEQSFERNLVYPIPRTQVCEVN